MKSDAALVKAASDGDRSAFGTLVQRYECAVRAVATHVLRDGHAAEDVAQDAFVIAYQKLPALRDGGAFGAWIVTIARREALRRLRRRAATVPLDSAGPAPEARREGQTSERLLAAVTRLPDRERHVVMLKHFNGLSVRDIARVTGRPAGTVTKQISRAYARLRKFLEDLER